MGKMRVVLLKGLVGLLYIALLVSLARDCGGRRRASSAQQLMAAPNLPFSTVGKLDPFCSGKRRVPNGPDPIHNRRAGNSKGPPGRG